VSNFTQPNSEINSKSILNNRQSHETKRNEEETKEKTRNCKPENTSRNTTRQEFHFAMDDGDEGGRANDRGARKKAEAAMQKIQAQDELEDVARRRERDRKRARKRQERLRREEDEESGSSAGFDGSDDESSDEESSLREIPNQEIDSITSKRQLRALRDVRQGRLDEISPHSRRIGTKQEVPLAGSSHWEYLLKEMKWMSDDFKTERNWKLTQQKKIAKLAQYGKERLFNRDLQQSSVMRRKARNICARIAREVRGFWEKVDRLVVHKHRTEYYAQQQKAMDKHLSFLVHQTERYTDMLADRLNRKRKREAAAVQAQAESSQKKRRRRREVEGREEEESASALDLEWEGKSEEDDEETLDQEGDPEEEELNSELANLKAEAEMGDEELLKQYGIDQGYISYNADTTEEDEGAITNENGKIPETFEEGSEAGADNSSVKSQEKRENEKEGKMNGVTKGATSNGAEDVDEDHEFEYQHESDDEETMEKEGEPDRDEAEQELKILKKEATMTREELLRVYYGKNELEREEENDAREQGNHKDGKTSGDEFVEVEEVSTDQEFKHEVPFLMDKELVLRPYQRQGMDWLISLFERRLNGILADEMGLGKTVQTIALLAHLAAERGIWGPHLIVVPTSVILNWEMEFKKFCPAFKVLTYYGTAKDRKLKRVGWSRPNCFQVLITSYQLVVQDASILKRKKWYYMVLDEAHNIKNFRSQRWQTLLNFNTKRRLMLTGTPLQNSLMELWSLMHFLMPHVFQSQSEFQYWFSNPLNAVVEGRGKATAAQTVLARQEQDRHNDMVIKRLHTVIRPFLLRRLKKDVATQLPGKFEHVVKLPLSRRQRFLYEDFISRSSTRDTLTNGGFLGMMAILMKLRMVCNHPNIFEPRIIDSPFNFNPMQVVYAARSLRVRNTCGRFGLNGSPLPALELDIGGEFGLAWRELGSHGSIKTKWEASELENLQPVKKALIEVVNSVDFEEDFLDDSLFSDVAKAALEEERERLKSELQDQRIQLVDSIHLRTQNLDRFVPVYGKDLQRCVTLGPEPGCSNPLSGSQFRMTRPGEAPFDPIDETEVMKSLAPTMSDKADAFSAMIEKFVIVPPKAVTSCPEIIVSGPQSSDPGFTEQELVNFRKSSQRAARAFTNPEPDGIFSGAIFHKAAVRETLAFPDKMLVQYDCGKLQYLASKLRELKSGGHRVLIFTQMTKMLDVLEVFLNIHGYTYFRLDGATKVDDRQRMMEKFNRDDRIFAFILSTRSGGLGVNLIGADTVIFYDSDWNPSMDAQAQDRAHRIGQTRDVHIYRLISEHTIEENILRKANQKRHLNKLSVEDGKFTVGAFLNSGGSVNRSDVIEMFNNEITDKALLDTEDEAQKKELELAMTSAEDESDKQAAIRAQQEAEEELDEFKEGLPERSVSPAAASKAGSADSETVVGEVDQDAPMTAHDLTQSEYQEIAARLKQIELLAITVRLRWFPVVDTITSLQQMKEMEDAQQEAWELERLEQEKLMMEDDSERHLIIASDGDNFDVSQFNRIKEKIVDRKLRQTLTGEGWTSYDTREGKTYWYHKESGERTWEKPMILESIDDHQFAEQHKWSGLQEQILVRVLMFADGPRERCTWARTCKAWENANLNPRFHIWVANMTDVQQRSDVRYNDCEFITVGSNVEFLNNGVDVWHAGVVSDVCPDGSYVVRTHEGIVRPGIRRALLRLDSGMRYTYIEPSKRQLKQGTGLVGVFRKHHGSRLCAGPLPPNPKLARSLEEALDIVRPGETIVLRAGLHQWDVSKFRMPKNIRVIGEKDLMLQGGIFEDLESLFDNVEGTVKPFASAMSASEALQNRQHSAQRQMPTPQVVSTQIKGLPTPPPDNDSFGVNVEEDDFFDARKIDEAAENDLYNTKLQAVLTAESGKEVVVKFSKGRSLWKSRQETGLEILGPSPLTFDDSGEVRFSGIAVFGEFDFRNSFEERYKIAAPETACGALIRGDSKVWIHDCSFSGGIRRSGSAVRLEEEEGDKMPLVCITNSVLSSSCEHGLELNGGSAIVMETSIKWNMKAGILVNKGALIVERSRIAKNGGHGVVMNGEKVAVCINGNDLRNNGEGPYVFNCDMHKDLVVVSNNMLGRVIGEKFKNPWRLAHFRRREHNTLLKQRHSSGGAVQRAPANSATKSSSSRNAKASLKKKRSSPSSAKQPKLPKIVLKRPRNEEEAVLLENDGRDSRLTRSAKRRKLEERRKVTRPASKNKTRKTTPRKRKKASASSSSSSSSLPASSRLRSLRRNPLRNADKAARVEEDDHSEVFDDSENEDEHNSASEKNSEKLRASKRPRSTRSTRSKP